jgi:uncharacterized membrane protein YphA (DoxX/SURF4 family)
MTIALWIVNVVLALVFLGAGGMKLGKSKEAYVAGGMAWAESQSAGTIKLIGTLEVLGAIGLIVPLATGIVPVLTPIAALCLTLTMVVATLVHGARKENPTPAVVLGVISAVSAVLGFLAL